MEPLSEYDCYCLNSSHNVNIELNRKKENASILQDRAPEYVRSDLLKLCEEFSDIFLLEGEPVTVNNFYKQELILKDKQAVYVKQYKLPAALKSEVNRQVNKYIEDDIIEPANSPYNNPILLVPKKSDKEKKWRLVVDFRKLNKKLIPDKYPIPRIDDIFDQLGSSRFFSIIDLASGFHQIELMPESRKYCAFSTPLGQLQFKSMMAMAFAKAIPEKAFLYIDDLCVISETENEHLDNLHFVFDICRKTNLKLNPQKCYFFQEEVIYLGHKLTRNGIMPDPGSDVSLIKIGSLRNFYLDLSKNIKIKGVTDGELNSLDTSKITFFIHSLELPFIFHVVSNDFPISTDGLIGRDFLNEYGVSVNYAYWTLD